MRTEERKKALRVCLRERHPSYSGKYIEGKDKLPWKRQEEDPIQSEGGTKEGFPYEVTSTLSTERTKGR